LRLAVHVGVEPDAFFVTARDQMDAFDGRATASLDAGDWLLGDTHWRHPVRIITYNDPGKL